MRRGVQRNVRLTDRQDGLWRAVLVDDRRWPPTWSLADRLAWVLERVEMGDIRWPQVEQPPR